MLTMTEPSEPQHVTARLVRALPRVAGVVVGLAVAASAHSGWLYWLGVAVFVLSIPLRPTAWWGYVMTGVAPGPRVPPEYTMPGTYRVELRSPGERPLDVIRALRESAGLSLLDAKDKVDHVPSTVAAGLSEESAGLVRDRVQHAGGTARVLDSADH